MVLFYVLFRLTGRLAVFFGNFAIKPFADIMSSYFCRNRNNKIKKMVHIITSSPCQNSRGSRQRFNYIINA
ncbi:hypothetical protein D352_00005 [Enterococcus faecium LA4B-2]|nr:hypothetical protein D352_00005 [Enterococcus faecium LA4B-2]